MITTLKLNSVEANTFIKANPGAWVLITGDTVEIRTGADMPPRTVPQTLPCRQFWLAIEDSGLTSAIKAAVAASPARVQIEVAQATEFSRNNPLLNQMAAAIGKSSADIDNIFIYGETL